MSEGLLATEHSDPLKELAEQVRKQRQEMAESHQKVLESPEYQAEWKHIEGATFHFIQAVHACFMMSRRAPDIYDQMLMFRLTDDLLQSCIATLFLIQNGMHNPAAREIRFMIESGVKQLFVDQQKSSQTFDEKLRFLHEEVNHSSISMVSELKLEAFDTASKKEFCDELTDVYYKQCAYIHPSQRQIEEMVAHAESGKPLGYKTADELRTIGRLMFRLYDMLLVLHFHGIGLGLAGDVLVEWFDDEPKWKFHKGKYTKRLSSYFDYKVERTERKSGIPAWEPLLSEEKE